MDNVRISDRTMRQAEGSKDISLSFKEKIELAKQLDRLGVSVIELEGIKQKKVDLLRIKSIAAAVKEAEIAVPAGLDRDSIETIWSALKEAVNPRLQIEVPVSTVQMEYIFHMKPDKLSAAVVNAIGICKEFTDNVEFIALDSTRADDTFLYRIINEAITAGASTVTLENSTGSMLPKEFGEFLDRVLENVPAITSVVMGVSCSDNLHMADNCGIAAVGRGAREIKCSAYPTGIISLGNVSQILNVRSDAYDASCPISVARLGRTLSQIEWICSSGKGKKPVGTEEDTEDRDAGVLSCHDTKEAVAGVVRKLGYDLNDDDEEAVWNAFCEIAQKKETISSREIDAIVASVALQVPATYKLATYVVNSGNNISAMAHIKLKKDEDTIEGMAVGDGPIDAAFKALKQILGQNCELDTFQIRSVTEGQEAMGETVVRLLSNGKLYSGRGISTDIVGSSIQAYVNALNKIAFEEEEA